MKIVNWESRWDMEMPRSRAHDGLMKYIQTHPGKFEDMRTEHGLGKYSQDCRVWEPKGREVGGAFYTSNSIRLGWHARNLPFAQRVLEIGPGFGALPQLWREWDEYFLYDHPRMTEMQRAYLRDCGVGGVEATEDLGLEVDLVVAINSITEQDARPFYEQINAPFIYVVGMEHRGLDVLSHPRWEVQDEWEFGPGRGRSATQVNGRARLMARSSG